MLNGHGDDSHLYHDIRANFSSNIYTHPDLEPLKAHLATCLDTIGQYPEPEAHTLERAIARHYDIPEESVLVTNGATDAIYMVAHLLHDRGFKAFDTLRPTFSEYADACRLHGLSDTADRPTSETAFWLCNPNNPTGHVIDRHDVMEMARRHGMLVVDQAYEDYTLQSLLAPHEATAYENVILLHSLTKKHAIPGLRVGFLTAHPALVDTLRRYLRPWSVNAIAIHAGLYLLQHPLTARPDTAALLAEAQRLRQMLLGIDGISVRPTSTNFMLCETHFCTAATLKQMLVERHHLLIRDASNFEGLGAGHFRVAAQTPAEDDLLAAAIAETRESLS